MARAPTSGVRMGGPGSSLERNWLSGAPAGGRGREVVDRMDTETRASLDAMQENLVRRMDERNAETR